MREGTGTVTVRGKRNIAIGVEMKGGTERGGRDGMGGMGWEGWDGRDWMGGMGCRVEGA